MINIAADHQTFMTLNGELSWQRLRRSAVAVYSKTRKNRSEPPFRALRGNVCTPSMARWKARGQIYIRRNWNFLLSPTVETLWAEIGQNRLSLKGVGHFSTDFRGKGASPTNHSWHQSSRVIARSCAIKVSAVRHLDLSQSTCVTNGRTELWLPRPPSQMLEQ